MKHCSALGAFLILFGVAGPLSAQQDAKDTELRRKAERFVPTDSKPKHTVGKGRRAVMKYQYRIEFFSLPADAEMVGDPRWGEMQVSHAGKTSSFRESSISPAKTLEFKRPVKVWFARTASGEPVFGNLIACTDLQKGYVPANEEEATILRFKGQEHGIAWVNPRGSAEDFCGVLSPEGNILYKFPFAQKRPDKLLEPIEVSPNGKRAVVAVVEETLDPDGRPTVGYPREVLVWEHPDKLKRYALDSAPKEIQELLAPWPRKPEK